MDGGWCSVARVAYILQKDWVQGGTCEGNDRLWNAGAGRLDRDIIVLFEVDTGMLFGGIFSITVQLLFKARITPPDDVLTVPPDAKAR